jgi:hypothetical protein
MDRRLDRVERSLGPEGARITFHHCTEHDGLPWGSTPSCTGTR